MEVRSRVGGSGKRGKCNAPGCWRSKSLWLWAVLVGCCCSLFSLPPSYPTGGMVLKNSSKEQKSASFFRLFIFLLGCERTRVTSEDPARSRSSTHSVIVSGLGEDRVFGFRVWVLQLPLTMLAGVAHGCVLFNLIRTYKKHTRYPNINTEKSSTAAGAMAIGIGLGHLT